MRRHKYGASKTVCAAGHNHPSRKEARRCDDLHLLQRAGAISDLVVEPRFKFDIGGPVLRGLNNRVLSYRPDFGYKEGGKPVVEDVKSKATMTADASLRMAIFRAYYPAYELRIV